MGELRVAAVLGAGTMGHGIGQVLAQVEYYGLGFEYFSHYPKWIERVTKEDVQRVARQYLDPQHYALVERMQADDDPSVQRLASALLVRWRVTQKDNVADAAVPALELAEGDRLATLPGPDPALDREGGRDARAKREVERGAVATCRPEPDLGERRASDVRAHGERAQVGEDRFR